MNNPLRALLIDDNPDDRALVIRELRREFPDLQVTQIADTKGLAQALEAGDFDLVITDYQLRWTDGLAVLRAVKAKYPDCPIIMFTGTGNEEVAVEAMKAGLDDYVIKSVKHFSRLPAAVRSVLMKAQQREALKEAETRYRDLFAGVPVGLYRATPGGQILDANPALVRLLGYPDSETLLAAKTADLYADPEERQRWHGLMEREGLVRNFEVQFRRYDGSIIWVENNARAVRDVNGWLMYYEGSIEDITERKRAEETLRSLYRASLHIQEPLTVPERLDRVLQTARNILHLDRLHVLLTDPEGDWLQAVASLGTEEPLEAIRVPIGLEGGGIALAYLNQKAVVWDGRGPVPERLRLKPPYDRIAAFRSRVFANVPLVVQGRAIGVLAADRKHTRRPFDPAMVDLLHLFAAQAALAIEYAKLYEGLEAKVEDRTRELQAANTQLQEAMQRMQEALLSKSEFLANISHELRTPLHSIIGFSELLEDRTVPLTAKHKRYMQTIWESGKHLRRLVNDLLNLSKMEAGKVELRPEAFQLPEALTAALTAFRAEADRKELELQLDVEACPATLTADPTRFRQIIDNVLSNAVKFTPKRGKVTVIARGIQDTFVEIVVTDTGIGIKAEDFPKLFQPFTQLDPVLSKRFQGTGLGLALTKRLVELHRGEIWAESEGEGRGSTFTIRLPVAGTPRSHPIDDLR